MAERFPRWPEDTDADSFLAEVMPLVERDGYRLSTDEEFVEMVLEGLMMNLEDRGDVFCPCRMQTGDFAEDRGTVCPCIPSNRELFARLGKCWCGLFVRDDVEDDEALFGVVEDDIDDDAPLRLPLVSLKHFPVGSIRSLEVGKRTITVIRPTEDDVKAALGGCPHMGANLADAFIEDGELVCPLHGWRFDLDEGTTDHPNARLRMLDVERVGDVVYTTLT